MSEKYLPHKEGYTLVIRADKKISSQSTLRWIIASISIYIMIVPLLLTDLLLWQYQIIFFSILNIPKIRRSEYIVFDRKNLKRLKWLQRLNCVYCEYANGVVAYAKAVTNQTEIYTCAIKHRTHLKGQDHQKEFFPYEDFE